MVPGLHALIDRLHCTLGGSKYLKDGLAQARKAARAPHASDCPRFATRAVPGNILESISSTLWDTALGLSVGKYSLKQVA